MLVDVKRVQAVGRKEGLVKEVALLTNVNNVNLLLWSQRMVTKGICPTIDPKILAFLQHKDKLKKFKIELITGVCRETSQGWDVLGGSR